MQTQQSVRSRLCLNDWRRFRGFFWSGIYHHRLYHIPSLAVQQLEALLTQPNGDLERCLNHHRSLRSKSRALHRPVYSRRHLDTVGISLSPVTPRAVSQNQIFSAGVIFLTSQIVTGISFIWPHVFPTFSSYGKVSPCGFPTSGHASSGKVNLSRSFRHSITSPFRSSKH